MIINSNILAYFWPVFTHFYHESDEDTYLCEIKLCFVTLLIKHSFFDQIHI